MASKRKAEPVSLKEIEAAVEQTASEPVVDATADEQGQEAVMDEKTREIVKEKLEQRRKRSRVSQHPIGIGWRDFNIALVRASLANRTDLEVLSILATSLLGSLRSRCKATLLSLAMSLVSGCLAAPR